MSKPNKNKTYHSLFLLIFCMLLLTAFYGCGTGPDTAATSSPTTPKSGTASLTLSFSSSVVTYGTPVTATATFTDANGTPVQNAVVTFAEVTNNFLVFTPTSKTALTNASGIASIIVNAASIDSAGAASVTASASVTTAGTTVPVTSAAVGIAVNAATVTLGTFALSQPSISAYGTSIITIPVYVNSILATVPMSVAFTSPCVSSSKATLTSPVTTIAGTATSTYKDNNCSSGTDLITASVTGATKSATITVIPPATSNIQFVSATPAIIGIQGSGASTLPQSSVVKFQVVDSSNNAKSGVLVDFSLLPANYAELGITMSASSATSDVNGNVTTSVVSGTVPTPVWVVAKVDSNPAIVTQSNTLTITTGLPTQDFFSLSVSTHNIEGWEYDGEPSTLNVIASDRLGNPVPDGTVINFISEGCQITPASCTTGTTASGTCTVTFKSAESRPRNETPGVAALDENGNPITINGNPVVVINGRVTIMAYAVGEKSFIDANFNNKYDAGETFYDLGVPYLDANENGQWDVGETFIPYDNPVGTQACLTHPSLAPLPDIYLTSPSQTNTCTGTWGLNYVRREHVIILSSLHPQISQNTFQMDSSCTRSFSFWLMDENGNPMPVGTVVDTANTNIVFKAQGAPTTSPATVSVLGTPVVDTTHAGGTRIQLTVDGGSACTAKTPDAYPAGTTYIKITTLSPHALTTYIPVVVN